jgi:predicted Zn finger-like uncharacterized protein
MIISCPACSRKFKVNPEAFQNLEGRFVRCSGCGYQWNQKPEFLTLDSSQELETTQAQEIQKEVRETSHLVGWLLFTIALFVVIPSVMILSRQQISKQWPKMASFYNYIGLPVQHADHSFQFKNTSWQESYKDNNVVLTLQGNIAYIPDLDIARTVPPVQVIVHAQQGPACEPENWAQKVFGRKDAYQEKGLCVVDRWNFQTSDNLALPGEIVPFQISKTYPHNIRPKAVVLEFLDT